MFHFSFPAGVGAVMAQQVNKEAILSLPPYPSRHGGSLPNWPFTAFKAQHVLQCLLALPRTFYPLPITPGIYNPASNSTFGCGWGWPALRRAVVLNLL
jgi:hypothetical protein